MMDYFSQLILLSFLCFCGSYVHGITMGGNNVCSYSCTEKYNVSEKVDTDCGFGGWSRCASTQVKTEYRMVTCHRCCTGWSAEEGSDNCDLASCHGISPPGTCLNGGTCVRPEECICPQGTLLPRCIDIDECKTGNHGCGDKCLNTVGSYYCECKFDRALLDDKRSCAYECFGEPAGTCSNGGACVATDVCECPEGTSLPKCEDIDECATMEDICEYECINEPVSYKCSCPEGYKVTADKKTCGAVCYNFEVGTCLNEHKCAAPNNCTCTKGFTEPFCEDADECANAQLNSCQHKCINEIGKYSCGCNTGYSLASNGFSCDDDNECLDNNGGCAEICNNIPGSFTCDCSAGYTLAEDQASCEDVDECSTGNYTCDSLCENTIGTYRCTCAEGFGWSFSEHICKPTCYGGSPGLCPNLGTCVAIDQCECQPGYGGDLCDDIDECQENNGGCQEICNNEEGSFYCSCHPGYTLIVDDNTCQDINECAVNDSICELGCNNIPGTYTCDCEERYRWDNRTMACKPVCFGERPGDCVNGGKCNAPDQCSCLEGYSLPRCEDIDECSGNISVCELACNNVPGTYICDCEDGFKWMPIPKTCKAVCGGNEPGGCPNAGVCNTPNVCTCADGFEAPDCTDIDECALDIAGCGPDKCENLEGSFRCNCEAGYLWNTEHAECLADCGSANSGMCSNGGTCESPGVCVCSPGFSEPNCTDIDECAEGSVCENGCVNLNGSYYCLGEQPGYGIVPGQKNEKPVCFGLLPGTCDNGGACVQPDLCNCPPGYVVPHCSDVDECESGEATCSGDCVNLPGTYYCKTTDGYGRLPGETIDRPVCYNFLPGSCPHGGECVSPGICTCKEGYKTPQCTDKNECLENAGGCDKECVNIPGSYFCKCWQGYGKLALNTDCKPICPDSLPGSCPNGGTCTAPSVCSCANGFEPPLCTDINECVENNGGCDLKCKNEPGVFSCECRNGWQWDYTKMSCRPVCFGMSPGECLNGGVCIAPDVCSCPHNFQTENCADVNECSQIDNGCEFDCVNQNDGYYCETDRPGYGRLPGTQTDLPVCFGNSLGSCANGGTCVEPGVCSCLPGFNTLQCSDEDECESSPCDSGCVNTEGAYYCQGEPGYGKGPEDEIFKPLCHGESPGVCANGGSCIQPGTCICLPGFELPDCSDINECEVMETIDCGDEKCINTPGSYHCPCPVGKEWNPDQQQCLPVCFGLTPGSCSNGGTCVKENVCTCIPGFQEPDCSEINECEEMQVNCPNDCVNTFGSYYCSSERPGYGRIPGQNEDLPVCFGEMPGRCKNGGECMEPDQCSCPVGYETTDCSDVNECETDNGGCDSQCTNMDGSYFCDCGQGYVWDDINHGCLAVCYGEEPGRCANNGSCLRPWICSCKPGFQVPQCTDVDECSLNNGGCGDEICHNELGYFYCDCAEEFGWDSLDKACKAVCHDMKPGECPNGGDCIRPGVCNCLSGYTSSLCTDINECDVENGGCSGECVNVPGTHFCRTSEGHGTLPGQSEELPLCHQLPPGNCPNDGTCISPESCECKHGYLPPLCDDYDECSQEGICELECHNMDGSYSCDCRQGYEWDYSGSECKPSCFGLPAGVCPNGGTCIRPGVCTCAPGYKTPDCSDINECLKDSGLCVLGCNNEIGTYSCDCQDGFKWHYNDMKCLPMCFGLTGECQNGGRCIAPDICKCTEGFGQPECLDIDECALPEPVCESGQCTNVIGSYKCGCEQGYSWNILQGRCLAVCGDNDPGECPNGGLCLTPGVCSCQSGFQSTNNCEDIDECSTNNGGCDLGCVNLPGSYYCMCQGEYGKTPTDTACKPLCFGEAPGKCGNGGVCTSPGSCSCQSGFQPPQCTDIDECTEQNGGCEFDCENVLGTYQCSCQSGYDWNPEEKTCQPSCFENKVGECENGGVCTEPNVCSCQLGFDPPSCSDIDECRMGIDSCSGECKNTVGSYYCMSDRAGYGFLPGDGKERAICNGKKPGSCSHGGFCYAPNMCHCKTGFIHQQGDCADIDECSEENACSNGCVNTEGSYHCVCEAGYVWNEEEQMCKAVCDDYPPGECKNHGECAQPGVCLCNKGFQQPDCSDFDECLTDEANICELSCSNIAGHFYCTSRRPGYGIIPGETVEKPLCDNIHGPGECQNGGTCVRPGTCLCSPGYLPPLCADDDECKAPIPDCMTCTNLPGSYQCECDPGYQWDSTKLSCQAICFDFPLGTCDNGGTCIEPYTCSCQTGFLLPQCQDDNECKEDNGGCSQDCENTMGSFLCHCKPGFTLMVDEATCTDDDECLKDNGGCPQDCLNTQGSYQCVCYPGYQTENMSNDCIDIDECAVNNGDCLEVCVNTEGSYYCSCFEGKALSDSGLCLPMCYYFPAGTCGEHGVCTSPDRCNCEVGFDKPKCTDIDECDTEDGKGNCEHVCENSEGSYSCHCYNGYMLDLDDQQHCSDIDECGKWPNPCSHICYNTPGSYICLCEDGFHLGQDQSTCEKDDPCDTDNGGCPFPYRCANTPEGVRCDCQMGFSRGGAGDCEDSDECLISNGDCAHYCINTAGSYYCECWNKFELMPDLRSCQACEDTGPNINCWGLCKEVQGDCICPSDRYLHHDKQHCVATCQCLNGGYCKTLFPDYQCDCEGTGYRGELCTVPAVDIPSVTRLHVSSSGILVKVLALDVNNLTITSHHHTGITVTPGIVNLITATPTADFLISTDSAGIFDVLFTLTGSDAHRFNQPIHSSVYSGDIFVREQLYDYQLPVGCFKLEIHSRVKDQNGKSVLSKVIFLSTSPWFKVKKLPDIKFTHGVVVLTGDDVIKLPCFDNGVELVVEGGNIIMGPVSTFRKIDDTSMEAGIKTNPRCSELDIPPEEVYLLQQEQSINNMFKLALASRLPGWFSFRPQWKTLTYSQLFYPALLTGRELQNILSCSSFPVFQTEYYYTLRFTDSLTIQVFGQQIELPKTTVTDEYCLILSLSNIVDLFGLSFPKTSQTSLKQLYAIDSLRQEAGLDIDVKALAFSNAGKVPQKSVEDFTLWNGHEPIQISPSSSSALWFSLAVRKDLVEDKQNITFVASFQTFLPSSSLNKVLNHFAGLPDTSLWVKDKFEIRLKSKLVNRVEELVIHAEPSALGHVTFGKKENRTICEEKTNPKGIFLKVAAIDGDILNEAGLINNLTFLPDNTSYLMIRWSTLNQTLFPEDYTSLLSYLSLAEQSTYNALQCINNWHTSHIDKAGIELLSQVSSIKSIIVSIQDSTANFLARNTSSNLKDFLTISEEMNTKVEEAFIMIVHLANQIVLTFQPLNEEIQCLQSNITSLQNTFSKMTGKVLRLTADLLPEMSEFVIKSPMQFSIEGQLCTVDGEFKYWKRGTVDTCNPSKMWDFVPSVVIESSVLMCQKSRTPAGILRNFLITSGSKVSLAFSHEDVFINLKTSFLFCGIFLDTHLTINSSRVYFEGTGKLWYMYPVTISGSIPTESLTGLEWHLQVKGRFLEEHGVSFSKMLKTRLQKHLSAMLSRFIARKSQAQKLVDQFSSSHHDAQEQLTALDVELDKLKSEENDTTKVIQETDNHIAALKFYLKDIGFSSLVCQPSFCKLVCLAGGKIGECMFSDDMGPFPCLLIDSCLLKLTNVSCFVGNFACHTVLISGLQSQNLSEESVLLEKLKELVETSDLLKLQLEDRVYEQKIVSLKRRATALLLSHAERSIEYGKEALQKLERDNVAMLYLQDFVKKNGHQNLFTLRDCGFDVGFTLEQPYEFDIHCDINPLLIGHSQVTFPINFAILSSSITNIAHIFTTTLMNHILKANTKANKNEVLSFVNIRQELSSHLNFLDLNFKQNLSGTICSDFANAYSLITKGFSSLSNVIDQSLHYIQTAQKLDVNFPNLGLNLDLINVTAASDYYELSETDIRQIITNGNLHSNVVIRTVKYQYGIVKSDTSSAVTYVKDLSLILVWGDFINEWMEEQVSIDKYFGFYDFTKWGFYVFEDVTKLVETDRIINDINIIRLLHNSLSSLFENVHLEAQKKYVDEILNLLSQVYMTLSDICSPLIQTNLEPIKPVQISVGQDINLPCPLPSDITASTVWRKKNSSMVFMDQERRLTLTNVTLSDEGTYNCYTISHKGIRISPDIQIIVVEAPTLLSDLPLTYSMLEGDSTMLNCDATGQEPLVTSWKTNSRLPVHNTSALVISNATLEASGIYQCKVTNPHGKVSTSEMFLSVRKSKSPCPYVRYRFSYISGPKAEQRVDIETYELTFKDEFLRALSAVFHDKANQFQVSDVKLFEKRQEGEFTVGFISCQDTGYCVRGNCETQFRNKHERLHTFLTVFSSVRGSVFLFEANKNFYYFNSAYFRVIADGAVCADGQEPTDRFLCVGEMSTGGKSENFLGEYPISAPLNLTIIGDHIHWQPPIEGRNFIEGYEVQIVRSDGLVLINQSTDHLSFKLPATEENQAHNISVRAVSKTHKGAWAQFLMETEEEESLVALYAGIFGTVAALTSAGLTGSFLWKKYLSHKRIFPI